MATPAADLQAAIAVTRFGLGARPGEIAQATGDPRGWLKAQIRPEGAELPNRQEELPARIAELRDLRQARQMVKQDGAARDPVQQAQRLIRDETGADFLARAQLGASTAEGFRERWALFWANHFTVSATKTATATLIGPFEADAIRPHVFGRFSDVLAAAETHPAMLLYLDQAQSVGPNSMAAQRAGAAGRRAVGLNENLAREILELHTVGVGGGYTQGDVTEFARAMTGISVGGLGAAANELQPVVFRPNAHEPGVRTILGVSYQQAGREQATAVLADLAQKPAAAHFISTKIARHFVADDPPPGLVARLERAWLGSKGDLAVVAHALVDAPEAWAPAAAKFKTPYEFVISCYRAVGAQPQEVRPIAATLTGLGQKPFSAPSPKGWPDDGGDWAAPDGVIKRLQFAQAFAAMAARGGDPKALAVDALGARLAPATATAVARAESRPEALALLLMSPEFQRR